MDFEENNEKPETSIANKSKESNISSCSSYWLIDASIGIYQTHSTDKEDNYFNKAFDTYEMIMRSKCSENSTDNIGLMIFRINKNNEDPFIENTWIVNELSRANFEQCKVVHKIVKEGCTFESHQSLNSLNEAMRHASNKLSSIKHTMLFKKIIIVTCDDNPYADHPKLQHELRLKAKQMFDMGLDLDVIGIGKEWNKDLFWRDILLIFGKVYKVPKTLDEIADEVECPARLLRQTELEIVEGVALPVHIYTVASKTEIGKDYKLDGTTNTTIQSLTMRKLEEEGEADDKWEDDEEEYVSPFVLGEDVVYKSETYGEKEATFSADEVKSIRDIAKEALDMKGIKVLGYQKIDDEPDLFVEHHLSAPYFVTPSKASSEVQKQFFAAFLNECNNLKVIANCVATLFTEPKLYSLIPSESDGGFYLYPEAFAEQHVEEALNEENIDNEEEEIDNNEIFLLQKLISEGTGENAANIDGYFVQEEVQDCYLSAIAMEDEDLKLEKITDYIDEEIKDFEKKIENTLTTYLKLYPPEIKRGSKRSAEESLSELKSMLDNNGLSRCTAVKLKEYAAALGISTSGTKSIISQRIIEKCRENKQMKL